MAYALFFTAEALAHAYVIPDDAFGAWLPILCFSLSVPVIIASYSWIDMNVGMTERKADLSIL